MHEKFIRKSIQLAQEARATGNHPFGALLVYDGKIVMRALNTVLTERDITGHAELNLVREAWSALDQDFLRGCTLYTSTEPCAMCATAIYWAGIQRVVYGLSASRLHTHTGAEETLDLPCREVFERGSHAGIEVIGPVLEDEALQPHVGFWV